MKAIIPVAGLGTRMLPATKAIPKEMLTVVDKPLIQLVVEEISAAGVKEIVLVTHSSKNSIENHFDTSFELEATLESRVKRQLLSEIKSICPPDVKIISVRQPSPKGLGHAVLCALPVVGAHDVMVVLPDVLLSPYSCSPRKDNLSAMKQRFYDTGASQIMVEKVPSSKVNDYGIVDLEDVALRTGQHARIFDMVEKPSIEDAPSDLAVVGRYILSKDIWPLLQATLPGASGEIQLTDAILSLIKQERPVEAYYIVGESHDCGSKLGYMLANIHYAINHPVIGADFKEKLNQFNKDVL